MYEFTHGGLWFDWRALDRASKRLAAYSLIAASIAGVFLAIILGGLPYDAGYRLGYWLASGHAPTRIYRPLIVAPWMAWVTLALLAISAIFWWRFSLRQDELFNRVQNWALGMGGAWTAAALAAWAVLALGGVVGPVQPLPLIVGFWCAVVGCWMIAVRRWA